MNSGCQDFTTSCRLDFRTSVSTEVSTEFSHSVSTEVSQSLFGRASLPGPSILTGLVPEVGFGNGWFASLRWPANKRERDVIFDPFLSPRNIICFGTRQAVFSVTRNILGNENSLPARGGVKTPPKSSFFTGHPVCRDRFSSDQRDLAIFTRNWLRRTSFLHITAQKTRQILQDLPREKARFDPIFRE